MKEDRERYRSRERALEGREEPGGGGVKGGRVGRREREREGEGEKE